MISILESSGYTVLVSGNGTRALQLAGKSDNRIDMLLTDVVMPGMSGTELYTRIKKINPDIKILYMSGYNEEIVDQHNILKDQNSFIQKPFTLTELQKKIQTVLGQTAD